MAKLNLQPPLATDLRSQAHLQLIERLGSLDLSPILVYRIPSLVNSAVLAMSWQWDVLNPLLLPLAGSGSLASQYRTLIQLSVPLHALNGTPQALLNALHALGYGGIVIQEGQNTWGGSQYPSNQGWAVFRVLIDLSRVPGGVQLTQLIPQTTAICLYWKPARCWLDSVQFQWYLQDTLIPAPSDFLLSAFAQVSVVSPQVSDIITGLAWPLADTKTVAPRYNARYYFSGITYGANQPIVADGPIVVNGTPVT